MSLPVNRQPLRLQTDVSEYASKPLETEGKQFDSHKTVHRWGSRKIGNISEEGGDASLKIEQRVTSILELQKGAVEELPDREHSSHEASETVKHGGKNLRNSRTSSSWR